MSWSPDGENIAFTVTFSDRIELYLADAASGQASRLIDRPLNAISSPYDWMPDGQTLLVLATSATRGPLPEEPAVPSTPVVQENMGGAAPARTYQDLLSTPYEEDLYEWLMQSDVLKVALDGFGIRFRDDRNRVIPVTISKRRLCVDPDHASSIFLPSTSVSFS